MPYTGNEKEKPKCPRCKTAMKFLMTDASTGMGGYRCEECDMSCKGGVNMVGNFVVGRA